MKFQYIPGWIELNFQDISCAVYHTNVEIIYSHVFNIFYVSAADAKTKMCVIKLNTYHNTNIMSTLTAQAISTQ